MKIPMNKKYSRGLVMDPASGTLQPVDRNHYIQQWLYGATEPAILKLTNFMYDGPMRTKAYNKLATPSFLPREVVVSTEAACRFMDFIYSAEQDNDSPRMATTKCVCQTALDTYSEPVEKDMALLYTANLYTTVKHTAIGEPYHIIETAEEAKKLLWEFDAAGLVHTIMYCNGNGRWTFVVCNCDDKICVPMKAYLLGRRDQVLAGPERVELDSTKCEGCDTCGKCLDRCMFDANFIGEDGKSRVNPSMCLGCGLCATTCPTKARTMVPREDYQHEDKVTTKILLAQT